MRDTRLALLFTILCMLAGCGDSTSVQAGSNSAASNNNAAPPPATALPAYDVAATPGMVRVHNKGYILRSAIWPKSGDGTYVVPVCWDPSTPTGPERDWVRRIVLSTWQAHSKLRFIGWSTCAPNAAGVRIAVRDDGENDGPHTTGLGTELQNSNGQPGMVLNFTFTTWGQVCSQSDSQRQSCIESIAVHEFGHAIGFAHEQNRPDTPGECAQKPQGENGDAMLTPWDLHSVMNYCNPVYNNGGALSDGDITTLHAIYGS